MPTNLRKGQLQITDDAKPFKAQHTHPCPDCPWTRKSVPGWLGPETVQGWLCLAHSDTTIPCHTRKMADGSDEHHQCAGAAIYRANTCKSVEEPILELPADRTTVFSRSVEFANHHAPGEPAPMIIPYGLLLASRSHQDEM